MAERKLRHILNVARTLMFHAHIPKIYWGDAIFTAGFLINRMPCPVIDNCIPVNCLSHDAILFHIAPRILVVLFLCMFWR